MGHIITFSRNIEASPDALFARLTDVAVLPSWNRAIREVFQQPETLVPGAIWKVRIHAQGATWTSKSELIELDRVSRRFSYRSQSDDGNPSYADWAWAVDAVASGSKVTVTVDINPKTFLRRHLLIRVRKPGLRKEMETSLAKLSDAVRGAEGLGTTDGS